MWKYQKATVKGVSILELADEQRKGVAPGQRSLNHEYMGIIMDKTDVTFMKAPDSAIKIKSSVKKYVNQFWLSGEFTFSH